MTTSDAVLHGTAWTRGGLGAAALLGGGFLLGAALSAVGAMAGPSAVVAAPVVLAAVLSVLARPSRAVTLVVLAVPIGFVPVPVAGLQVVEVTVLGATGLVVLHQLIRGQAPLRWPAVAWWPAAMLGLGALSTATAADTALAVKQMALLVGGLLLFLTTVTVVRDLAVLRRVTRWLAGVGGLVSAQGVLGAGQLQARAGGAAVDNRPTGIFTSPNQLGAMAGITVLLGVALVLGARSTRDRVVGTVAAVVGLTGLAATLSRGAWVGVAVALLVLVAVSPEARRSSMRGLVPVVLVLAVAGALLAPHVQPQVEVVRDRFDTLATGQTSRYDNRPAIWAEAVRQIRDAPLLGQGPGTFPVVSRYGVAETTTGGANHAHNTMLNVAAEFGLPVLLLLVGFALAIAGAARQAAVRLQPADRGLVLGVGSALVVQVAHGLVDYTLRNAVLAMVTWLLAGLLVAAREVTR